MPSQFERIVLEDDPDFDVRKEYAEELDYYYDTHPEDHATISPSRTQSLKSAVSGLVKGGRNAIVGLVEFRDDLYGYNKGSKEPGLRLKPVDEMKFLPDTFDGGTGMGSGFGLNVAPSHEFFTLGQNQEPIKKSPQKCRSMPKKACPCRTPRKDHKKPSAHKVKRNKETEPSDRFMHDGGILGSDPFGIGKRKGKSLF